MCAPGGRRRAWTTRAKRVPWEAGPPGLGPWRLPAPRAGKGARRARSSRCFVGGRSRVRSSRRRRWRATGSPRRRPGATRVSSSTRVGPRRSAPTFPSEFLEAVVPRAAVEVQGETDAPVTTDIHRLIRLPNSLHGGTGFRVVPLGRDEIAGFDPFRDALLSRYEETRTPVTYLEEARYPFPGGGVHAIPDGTDELPTPVALFLLLRGQAALRPSPG